VDGAKTVKVSRRSFEEYPNSETTRRSSGSKKAAEGSGNEDAETKLRLHKERRSPCEVDD